MMIALVVLSCLSRGWRHIFNQLDHLVDDSPEEAWALGAVGQLGHGQPQLVEHRPAVGIPS